MSWTERIINERLVITIIVINTLTIFLRGFPALSHLDPILLSIDYICCVYFLIETIIKLKLYGRAYFLSGWNRLDFAVVLLSIPHLFSPFFEVGDLAVILVLRSGRLLRFFRLLRFVPDAERVFAGIQRGLKASFGIMLALGLYDVVLSLGGCYLFRDVAPESFGDPLLSLYSLFKVFTVEGWYEIPDRVALTSTPFMAWSIRAYFVFAVVTGGLLGFSMANAVFVDEMVRDNNNKLEKMVHDLSAKLDAILQAQMMEKAHRELARSSASATLSKASATPPLTTPDTGEDYEDDDSHEL